MHFLRTILFVMLLALLGTADRMAEKGATRHGDLLEQTPLQGEIGAATLPITLSEQSEVTFARPAERLVRTHHPARLQGERLHKLLSGTTAIRQGGGWISPLKSSFLISRYAESSPSSYLDRLDRLNI
uniref:hypothetical protein n=1 Tax=Alistipes sp. TaxID=1872444 RepID=UPI0040562F85